MESIVRCINPKNFNLEMGEAYQVEKSEGNFLFVRNKNGQVKRYSKSLFEPISDQINEPSIRDDKEIIDHLILY